ncbi:MAG: hypothetical protein KKH04_21270 [Proteobacteria bacterium]|nr:hypothetical protein [Pseudomonadota bacterium]
MDIRLTIDTNARKDNSLKDLVATFLEKVPTIEKTQNVPVIISQDGVNKSYYIKCIIKASIVYPLFDLNAKLSSESLYFEKGMEEKKLNFDG